MVPDVRSNKYVIDSPQHHQNTANHISLIHQMTVYCVIIFGMIQNNFIFLLNNSLITNIYLYIYGNK
jgi:translation elongation factor EF-1alpha